MDFYVTGDIHGVIDRFFNSKISCRSDVGIIILGDSGCNFYKSKTKQHIIKSELNSFGCTFYMVRGNHDNRPENIEGMEIIFDDNVQGEVYYQLEYPYIRYLIDGKVYFFGKYKTLVVGGAYSVDKWYRIEKHLTWYSDEQLTKEEMDNILCTVNGDSFDFILSHTCPKDWEPRDLFLPSVNQATVDCSMEEWLNILKDAIKWKVWLFGHYHDDRIVHPYVEIFFESIESLNDIWSRWCDI